MMRRFLCLFVPFVLTAFAFAQSAGVRPGQILFAKSVGAGNDQLGVSIPTDESAPAKTSTIPRRGQVSGDKDASLRRSGPAAIGLSVDGHITVLDSVNRRVKTFTKAGRHLSTSQTTLTNLSALCVYKNGRYAVVSGGQRNVVTAFDALGKGVWQVTAGALVDNVYALPQDHLLIVFADPLRPSIVLDRAGQSLPNENGDPMAVPWRFASEGGKLYRVQARGEGETLRFEIETATIVFADTAPRLTIASGVTLTTPANSPLLQRIALRFRTLLLAADGSLFLVGSESVTRRESNDTTFIDVAALRNNGVVRDTFALPDDPFGSVSNIAADAAGGFYTLEFERGRRGGQQVRLRVASSVR